MPETNRFLRLTVSKQAGFARGESLRQKFPDLCRALCAKIGEQKRANLTAIEPALKQALQESLPPSLRKISKRLGFSATHLRRRAPLLCQELLLRQRTYSGQCHADLQNKPKAALIETLTPTLTDLYKRFGISGWIVWTNHPDLRRAITERHRSTRETNTKAPPVALLRHH